MKKSFFFVLGLVLSISSYSQVQFTKDTIFLEEKPVGYLSDLITEESTIMVKGKETTGTVVTYTISLFRTVTIDEKKEISLKYDPNESEYINVRFLEDFVFSSNQAKAGFMLYQAGELKTQRNNLYLTSVLVSSLGSLVYMRAMKTDSNLSTSLPTKVKESLPYITLSVGTVLTISAISKDYKANKKLKEAGVALQKE